MMTSNHHRILAAAGATCRRRGGFLGSAMAEHSLRQTWGLFGSFFFPIPAAARAAFEAGFHQEEARIEAEIAQGFLR